MKIKMEKFAGKADKGGEKIKLEVWIDTSDEVIVDKIGKDMKSIACYPHRPDIKFKTFQVCAFCRQLNKFYICSLCGQLERRSVVLRQKLLTNFRKKIFFCSRINH
jgi:hypothetical protein